MAGSGVPSWFETVLTEHLGALYQAALRYCRGSIADAEDLVQDTVLRALRAQDQVRSHETMRGWLFRALTTTHLNRVRGWRRRGEALAGDLGDEGFEEALTAWVPMAGPEEQLLLKVQAAEVAAALDQLAPELRATLWLRDAEGFSRREIAEMLDVPEGTVASRVFRARRALRATLTASASPSRTAAGGAA